MVSGGSLEVEASMHMEKRVETIREGYHSVTPYLVVSGALRVIEFLERTFDASELSRNAGPDGRIMHAEVRIGDSVVMIGEAGAQWPAMPSGLYVYVEDVDATYRRALQAGATSIAEPKDQFYGDRSGGVRDASGNVWWIGTHVEDVSPEEMERRQRTQQG
jgi:PhnB protein